MLEILYLLLFCSVVLTGGLIYRLTEAARQYRRSKLDNDGRTFFERPGAESYADWDLTLIRWAFISWLSTTVWGIVILGVHLIEVMGT